MVNLIRQLYALSIAFNTAFTAALFFPWVLPRETFSGFVGRHALCGCAFGRYMERIVDWMCFWERHHCRVTAKQEHRARTEMQYR